MSFEDRSGRIDKSRPVTLWRQLADDLTKEIDSGDLRPGARLPSEAELESLYGVARVTVRRAIAEMVKNGKLVVIHGRGTFVAEE